MRATRMVRVWDRRLAQFVEVPVQRTLDNGLACKDCRYFDEKSNNSFPSKIAAGKPWY